MKIISLSSSLLRNFFLILAISIPTLTFATSNYDYGVRIAWDYSTQKFVNTGGYARVKALSNGTLALVYSDDISVYFRSSTDGGKTWGSRIAVASSSDYEYTNSELVDLGNGKLLYAWNARPKASGSPYKIMTRLSSNWGQNWYSFTEKTPYKAGYDFGTGCWEPSFLLLPSGELQMYISNEYNVSGNDQNILLMRSTNNGTTWSTPQIISYRAGSRDGMPTAVTLKDGSIAMAIEDPGINGNFKPVIIHSTNNWNSGVITGSSIYRWHALATTDRLASSTYGGAPYLIRLKTGETVLSFQTDQDRNDKTSLADNIMEVCVGDENAKNFCGLSSPFGDVPEGATALWNSIEQIDDSTIIAVASISGYESGKDGVWTVKGKIMRPLLTPKLSTTTQDWNSIKSECIIGSESQAKMSAKSAWDDNNLYFHFTVKDKTLVSSESASWDNDGIETYIDINKVGRNATQIVTGLKKFLCNIKNDLFCEQVVTAGVWSSWTNNITKTVTTDANGYTIDVTIPWSDLGGKPSDNSFAVFYKLHNNDNGSTIYHENMSGGNPDKPLTWWISKMLTAEQTLSVSSTTSEDFTLTPLCPKRNEAITICSANDFLKGAKINIYNTEGQLLSSTKVTSERTTIKPINEKGIYIISIETGKGKNLQKKLTII